MMQALAAQHVRVAVLAAMLLAAGGCAAAKKTTPPRGKASTTRPATAKVDAAAPLSGGVTITDPCANRLHDLAGSLLLYYAVHRRLPEQIAELDQIAGPTARGALACPVSGQPYIYNPRGLLAPDTKSQIVLYDPAPSHAGRRWAVSIVEPTGDSDALVTKVVLLPDALFRPPAPAGTE